MKDYGFKIKVADLLHNPGTKDEVSFEKKFTKQIDNIWIEGIKGRVILQSTDPNTVHVILKDLEVVLEEVCEVCWKDYQRKVEVPLYEADFVMPAFHPDITEKVHDEYFLINPKDMTIDIEDMVVQAIWLTMPFVLRCEECQKNVENLLEIWDEFEVDESEGWRVKFI